MKTLSDTETELLTRISEGDEYAFAKLIRFYTPIIYKQLLVYVKNTQTAEELTQDIFIGIWRNKEKLKDMQNLGGYVFVAARNKINMAFREKLYATEQPSNDLLQTLVSGPEKRVEVKELSEILNHAITLLPPRRQQVFKLSRIENKSYEEIANQLSINKSAVKQHIIESLIFLRTYLKEKHGIIAGLLWLLVCK